MTLAEFLKKIRQQKGWGLRVVASMLEIDQSTLSKYENGHRLPTNEHIERFAKIYGMDEKELKKLFLIEQISTMVLNSGLENDFLKVAEEQVEYKRTKQEESKKLAKSKKK